MKYSTINIQGNLLSEEILQRLENANLDGQVVTDFGFDPKSSLKNEIEYAWSRIKLDWRNFYDKSQNLNPNDPYGTTLSRKWMEQFFETLGFDLNRAKKSLDGDNSKQYNISHIAENLDQLPIHLVGFFEPNYPEKNTLDIKTSGGTSRFSPHSLMQEYLNVTEHVYGISSNGMYLRLIRDSGRLIKLTYIEFDIKRLLEEDKYSEFTVLYRLLHSTRFPKLKSEVDQSIIEKYYQDSIETGNRIRDGLSLAVKESLIALGNGFLKHDKNNFLREKFISGDIDAKFYYQQLLRVIYRFLFLMVTEERDLIYDNDENNDLNLSKKSIYFKFYSIARLRKLSEIRYLYQEQFCDLWQGLVNTFELFEENGLGTKLGIEPLGGDLFKSTAIKDINESFISNKLLLECIKNLNEFRDENNNLVQINYRSLDVEELGSVYEGLLELLPVIENIEIGNPANCSFTFHEGTDRKTSGSYYTRPELVNELIKSALIPIIEERLKEHAGNIENQTKALLKLKVCDAAAGSGHMLLAAARTISWYLARVIGGEENPSPSLYRKCLRDVIQHCIYAVDYNPDAVELCKLALWLEGHNSGKPLSFLDHKIRNGNSLVGVTDLGVLQKGIPDDAFNPVTGDDKKVCQELKKQNVRYNKTKQGTFDFDQSIKIDTTSFTGKYKELENLQQDDVEGVKQVKTKFEKLRNNQNWFNDWRACNLWTATFFWNFTEKNKQDAPNSELLAKFLINSTGTNLSMVNRADSLSLEHKFFHWPLEFPDVFEQGGFDVMLGNPPWERIRLQEQEFFVTRDYSIANAANKAAREKLIKELEIKNPILFNQFQDALHSADCTSKHIRFSNKYPLTAIGDINTYSIFSEHYYKIINKNGCAGFIVPTGIATDDNNKFFFANIIEQNRLISLFDFENKEAIFPSVHRSYKFCLLILAGNNRPEKEESRFGFFLSRIEHLQDKLRIFGIKPGDFLKLNPNTKTCPIFRTRIDADIATKIYSSFPILKNEVNGENPWEVSYIPTFDTSIDSIHFKTKEDLRDYPFNGREYIAPDVIYIPVYEGKMVQMYDHRAANVIVNSDNLIRQAQPESTTTNDHENDSFIVNPQYWIDSSLMSYEPNKIIFGVKKVTGPSNERSFIGSYLPYTGITYSFKALSFLKENSFLITANTNSLPFDYFVKLKLGGVNLAEFIINQLPIIPPENYSTSETFKIAKRVMELTYTSWDLKAFADEIWKEVNDDLKVAIKQQWETNKQVTGGHDWRPPDWSKIDPDGCQLPPFKWDDARRSIIKAELDAIYAKLYGLTKDELRYILDPQDVYGLDFPGETFRVLKDKEIRLYGEYRTRRLVLEAWEKINL